MNDSNFFVLLYNSSYTLNGYLFVLALNQNLLKLSCLLKSFLASAQQNITLLHLGI